MNSVLRSSRFSVSPQPVSPSDSDNCQTSFRDLGVLILLAILLYLPLLNNWFVADDFCWLEEATLTQDRISHLFNLQISNFFRPLVHLLFYLEWNLFGKWGPGYYSVNLMVLLSGIGLFYMAIRRMVPDSRIAFLAGLIFSIQFSFHEAVLWISGVSSLLAGLWLLISIHCFLNYLSRSEIRWLALTLAAFVGGLLTKETSVIIPPLLLVVAVYARGRKGLSAWVRFILFAFPVILFYLGFQYYIQHSRGLVALGHYRLWGWHPLRLLAGGVLQLGIPLPKYLIRKAFMNWGIERDDLVAYLFIMNPIGALCLMAGLGWMIRSLRENYFQLFRLAIMAIAWMGIALLPFCFFPQAILPASRYMFIPAMGWSILLASLFLYRLERTGYRLILHGVFILWFALHALLIWMMEKDYEERGRELWRSIPELKLLSPSTDSLDIYADHPMGDSHFQSFGRLWAEREFKRISIQKVERQDRLEAIIGSLEKKDRLNAQRSSSQSTLILWKGQATLYFAHLLNTSTHIPEVD